jgi:hypothetical protein
MAPSVSYSITVRLEAASRGRAVSEITRVVEYTGGMVTALDATSSVAAAVKDAATSDVGTTELDR